MVQTMIGFATAFYGRYVCLTIVIISNNVTSQSQCREVARSARIPLITSYVLGGSPSLGGSPRT